MSQQWYYADRQRQQQGPLAGAELVGALKRGDVDMSTLVWHEGLPGWVPLAQVAAQLGVQGAPPPVPRAVERRPAVPRKSGSKVGLIIGGVMLGGLVLFGGIIAAIAIPAYSDYTIRARVSQRQIRCISTLTAEQVQAWPLVHSVQREGDWLRIVTPQPEPVLRELFAADAQVRDLEVQRAGLAEALQTIAREAA